LKVKAYGKVIEFKDGTPEDEIKKALGNLDPEKPAKDQRKDFESLRKEIEKCSKESTKKLIEAQKKHCDTICGVIQDNKPDQVASFDAKKIAEGEFKVTLNYV
jgi:hypothetical protein